MAWYKSLVTIGDVSVQGFAMHAPVPYVDVPYIPGITVGAKVTAMGLRGEYQVKSLLNPGGRNERLELALEPVPQPDATRPKATKRGGRKPSAKAGAADAA